MPDDSKLVPPEFRQTVDDAGFLANRKLVEVARDGAPNPPQDCSAVVKPEGRDGSLSHIARRDDQLGSRPASPGPDEIIAR
jgi:hypothetical protein